MLHYSGKTMLVLGLGETGLATARWLRQHAARVILADSRENPPNLAAVQAEMPEVPVFCGPFTEELFLGVDEIVASPGIAVASLPTRRPVIGDIEIFARALQHMPTPVIAITGSNGKSTVTSMVGAICKHAGLKTVVAGNIGLPVLAALAEAEAALAGGAVAPQVYVLELSSFQLETTVSLKPAAATVLNISEDHLDRYADMSAYVTAKTRVFAGHGVQVLNQDDPWVRGMDLFGRVVRRFSLEQASDFGLEEHGGRRWMVAQGKRFLALDEFGLTGLHNVANALAATALAQVVDVPLAVCAAALRQFKGLAHRVEPVLKKNGVLFLDDSKGTNVGATVAALDGLEQPVILIAGGDGKGQDFAPLAPAINRICKAVVLLGRDAPEIRRVLQDSDVMLVDARDMDEAVNLAWSQALAGDIVLLSPACASLDMFRNYAHRAEVFIAAAHALADKDAS
jgi:UDP-N-acetylmuramoylalanine--D-glutamate ligase